MALKRLALAAALALVVGAAGILPAALALDAAAPAAPVLRDGTWAGPRVATFYGYLQVEAVVSGGVLADAVVKEAPAHDGTSRRINSIAVPYLVKAAVSKGDAGVDTVSGATITSKAFNRSLGGALAEATR